MRAVLLIYSLGRTVSIVGKYKFKFDNSNNIFTCIFFKNHCPSILMDGYCEGIKSAYPVECVLAGSYPRKRESVGSMVEPRGKEKNRYVAICS